MVRVGYQINVSSNKYVNKIMCKYQNTHGDPKKELIPIRVKEQPVLDDSPFLNQKENKDSQPIIGACQGLIVSGIFELAYDVSSLSSLSDETQLGYIDIDRRTFGYLKN